MGNWTKVAVPTSELARSLQAAGWPGLLALVLLGALLLAASVLIRRAAVLARQRLSLRLAERRRSRRHGRARDAAIVLLAAGRPREAIERLTAAGLAATAHQLQAALLLDAPRAAVRATLPERRAVRAWRELGSPLRPVRLGAHGFASLVPPSQRASRIEGVAAPRDDEWTSRLTAAATRGLGPLGGARVSLGLGRPESAAALLDRWARDGWREARKVLTDDEKSFLRDEVLRGRATAALARAFVACGESVDVVIELARSGRTAQARELARLVGDGGARQVATVTATMGEDRDLIRAVAAVLADAMHPQHAAPLFEQLGVFLEAGRCWEAAREWDRARRCYVRAGEFEGSRRVTVAKKRRA